MQSKDAITDIGEATQPEFRKKGLDFRRTWPLHAMLIPGLVFIFLFEYLAMGGLVMAFQDYRPWLGIRNSPWIGLDHLRFVFTYPDSIQVIWNTLLISFFKIVLGLVVPLVFALALNEVRKSFLKRSIQTLVYLPHFLSWVVFGGIILDILSLRGAVNQILTNVFNMGPIFFLGEGGWFRFTLVITDVWKSFGFSAIVFLAALSGVDPNLYEAAQIDGANRWKQTWHITIPCISAVIIVVGTLSLGQILNAGFEQVLVLYNPLVYRYGDIIDTFVYRVGLLQGNFGFGTAVGLFKSVVGFTLIVFAYRLAYKLADYRIF